MSRRNWFFGVIVAAVFAAQFTLGVFWRVLQSFQTSAGGALWLEDPNHWVHLGFDAVLAIVFWGVAIWAWSRVEENLPTA